MTTYHPMLRSMTLQAAKELAEMTEYEAAGVLLRASVLMDDEEDGMVVLNLLRGAHDSCVQELGVQICKRIVGGTEFYLKHEGVY